MDVFPVSWSAGDTGPGDTCRITVFGKTPDARAACVHVRFTPFFYVELPKGTSEAQGRLQVTQWSKRYELLEDKCRVVTRTSLWGFRKPGLFALLAFPSMAAFRRARWGIGKEHGGTHEAAVDPVVRLFHLRGLGPCRWMRVARHSSPATLVADVDVEVECGHVDVGPSDFKGRPPLVFASECLGAGPVVYEPLPIRPFRPSLD